MPLSLNMKSIDPYSNKDQTNIMSYKLKGQSIFNRDFNSRRGIILFCYKVLNQHLNKNIIQLFNRIYRTKGRIKILAKTKKLITVCLPNSKSKPFFPCWSLTKQLFTLKILYKLKHLLNSQWPSQTSLVTC